MTTHQPFTPPHPLNTAVLFLVFNRLATTKKVFEAIRQAKPPRLYIAADGARETKEGEAEKVKAVRDYILKNIDWNCEVKTLFRDKNLGCKYAVSGGITWFFENEEQGIILEDDCLPSQSFFWFCEHNLTVFKNDPKVLSVSGNLREMKNVSSENLIYKSIYFNMWGWATWRESWLNYDVDFFENNDFENVSFGLLSKKKSVFNYWKRMFYLTKLGGVDSWDYQFTFYSFSVEGEHIYPSINMIHNIGFGPDATHTFSLISPVINNKAEEFLLTDRIDNKKPLESIDYLLEKEYSTKSIFERIANRFKRLL